MSEFMPDSIGPISYDSIDPRLREHMERTEAEVMQQQDLWPVEALQMLDLLGQRVGFHPKVITVPGGYSIAVDRVFAFLKSSKLVPMIRTIQGNRPNFYLTVDGSRLAAALEWEVGQQNPEYMDARYPGCEKKIKWQQEVIPSLAQRFGDHPLWQRTRHHLSLPIVPHTPQGIWRI